MMFQRSLGCLDQRWVPPWPSPRCPDGDDRAPVGPLLCGICREEIDRQSTAASAWTGLGREEIRVDAASVVSRIA